MRTGTAIDLVSSTHFHRFHPNGQVAFDRLKKSFDSAHLSAHRRGLPSPDAPVATPIRPPEGLRCWRIRRNLARRAGRTSSHHPRLRRSLALVKSSVEWIPELR